MYIFSTLSQNKNSDTNEKNKNCFDVTMLTPFNRMF